MNTSCHVLRLHYLRATIEIKLACFILGENACGHFIAPRIAHRVWTGAGVAPRDAHGVWTGAGVVPGMHTGPTIFMIQ